MSRPRYAAPRLAAAAAAYSRCRHVTLGSPQSVFSGDDPEGPALKWLLNYLYAPQDEKRLLQTAAVIGTEVPLPLLQAIAELSEEVLYRGLTHLQSAEFLYETSLFPERIYTFKHALTHEVAYGSLLQERRRTLHAQIAEVLEALYGDQLTDQVERLAHHAFRGEVWDKALLYFRQAGAKAMAHSAHREAAGCYEQALSALQQLPESHDIMEQAIDLRLELRSALITLGELERVFDYLREAEALAQALNDRRRLCRASSYLSVYFYLVGDPDQAIASSQRACTLADALGDVALQIGARFHLGVAYRAAGDYHQAIDCLRNSVASLEDKPLQERFGLIGPAAVQSRVFLILALAKVGMFTEGRARGEESVRIAETIENPFSLLWAYRGLSLVYLRQGDLPKAIPLLEHGLVVCQTVNNPVMSLLISSYVGYAYVLSGRIAEALSLLEQGMEQSVSMNYMVHHAFIVAWLSEAYLLDGRIEDANQLARRALELAQNHKERGHEAYALCLLGDIAMHYDPPDIDQAATHYHQALGLANELGMRPLQAHCHHGLGTLYSQTGQAEQACAELSTAIEMYRNMEMTFWLPETEAALADVEGKV
jgi:tetratricopeptide (TPR) repeat protein